MRALALLLLSGMLVACAGPLPPRDPQLAWIDLHAAAGHTLMADRLDGERVNDGRYFQVAPGAHDLQLRFQYEVNGGGAEEPSEPRLITCLVRIRYDGFAAGQRYRVEARPLAMRAQAWLYDGQRQLLAGGKVLRCGTF
jgi:hypothetical protein